MAIPLALRVVATIVFVPIALVHYHQETRASGEISGVAATAPFPGPVPGMARIADSFDSCTGNGTGAIILVAVAVWIILRAARLPKPSDQPAARAAFRRRYLVGHLLLAVVFVLIGLCSIVGWSMKVSVSDGSYWLWEYGSTGNNLALIAAMVGFWFALRWAAWRQAAVSPT